MSDVPVFQPSADETVKQGRRSTWVALRDIGRVVSMHIPEEGDRTERFRNILNEALGSGDVRALLHGELGRLSLKSSHNFCLDMLSSIVSLEEVPGETFDCEIHVGDLERFLIGHRVAQPPATANKIHEATKWFVARINANEVEINEKMAKKAHALFGVSLRQYRDARKEAIKLTGCTGLSNRGRRPADPNETKRVSKT